MTLASSPTSCALICALVLSPGIARADDAAAAKSGPLSATETAANEAAEKEAKARFRAELKREIAAFGMLALLSSSRDGAAKVKPSPWSRDPPAGAVPWASSIVDGPIEVRDHDDEDDGPAAPLATVSTIGKGDAAFDLDAFDGHPRTSRAHVMARLPGARSIGRVPGETIKRVVTAHYGGFRVCYEAGLRRRPRLAGRVAVKFVIDGTGTVTRASDAGSDLGDADVVACVVRGFMNLSFSASGDKMVWVVYPLVFSPAE